MKRFMVPVALSSLVVLSATVAAAEQMTMWGCSPLGERRNVLYLVERGSRSYVKVSGQRVTARYVKDENGEQWSFGTNRVVLQKDGLAKYYEHGAKEPKARFRCRSMAH